MTHPTPASERPRVRLRRNPRWLLGGVLAVVLGGLSTAFLFASLTASDPVLRLNRTVYRGEVLTAADLTVVSVARGLDVRTVPSSGLDAVVGQAAVVDLASGSLLVEGAVGPPELGQGLARVGVKVAAGRLPAASALTPGTSVLVVGLPGTGVGGAASEGPPASIGATLANAPSQLPDGQWVVDVIVPATSAESIARLSGADRVALVKLAPSR